jgi:c-di-GMP-binding flagellar brake protein YcgR
VKERRGSPRADIAIAVRTTPPGKPEEKIRTVNLSATGVCYESPRWIEPLTRLELTFVFPDDSQAEQDENRLVRVEAVVVRSDPPAESPTASSYRVACFFTAIDDEDRAYIDRFVNRILAEPTTTA